MYHENRGDLTNQPQVPLYIAQQDHTRLQYILASIFSEMENYNVLDL